MEAKVYVLHGYWDTIDDRGLTVVCTTFDEKEAIKKLVEIADTKGAEYCELCDEKLVIELDTRMFEMRDMMYGGFIGFYIVEQKVEIPDCIESAKSRIKKLEWKEVLWEHKKGKGLVGYFYLYDDETEAMIDEGYSWNDIVRHHENGGEFGYEIPEVRT